MRLRQEGGAGHRPFAAALQDAAAASLLDLRFETFEQIAQAFIAELAADDNPPLARGG